MASSFGLTPFLVSYALETVSHELVNISQHVNALLPELREAIRRVYPSAPVPGATAFPPIRAAIVGAIVSQAHQYMTCPAFNQLIDYEFPALGDDVFRVVREKFLPSAAPEGSCGFCESPVGVVAPQLAFLPMPREVRKFIYICNVRRTNGAQAIARAGNIAFPRFRAIAHPIQGAAVPPQA